MRGAALLLILACGCRVTPDAGSCMRAAEGRRVAVGLDSAQVIQAMGGEGVCWKEQGYCLNYDCGDAFVEFDFDRSGTCVATQTVPSMHTQVGVTPALFTVRSRTPAFDSPPGARVPRISAWRAESIQAHQRAAGNWHVGEALRWLGDAARIEWRDDGLLLLAGCEDGSQVRLGFDREGRMTGLRRSLPLIIWQ